MHKISIIYRIWLDSILRSIYSIRIIILIILSIILTLIVNENLIELAKDQQTAYNVIEAYLNMYTRLLVPVLILAIVTFIFCDAPFFTEGQSNIMYRTGRINWFIGKFFFIASMSLLLQLTMLISISLQSIDAGYIGNVWSKITYGASINKNSTINVIHPYVMLYNTPYTALFYTLLLNTLLYTLIGMILFSINMRYKRYYGYSCVMFFIILSVLAYYDIIPYWGSPIHMGMLSYYGYGQERKMLQIPFQGFILLSNSILLIGCIIIFQLRKTSFQFGE